MPGLNVPMQAGESCLLGRAEHLLGVGIPSLLCCLAEGPESHAAQPSDSMERKQCYYHIGDVHLCDSVLAKNVTKQECCCTVGAAWGDNCETYPCPIAGTGRLAALPPPGNASALPSSLVALTGCFLLSHLSLAPAPRPVEYQEVCPLGKGYVPQEDLLSGKVSFTGTSITSSTGEREGTVPSPAWGWSPKNISPGLWWGVLTSCSEKWMLSSIGEITDWQYHRAGKCLFLQSCLTAGSAPFSGEQPHAHFPPGMGSSKTQAFQLLISVSSGQLAQTLTLHLHGFVFSAFQKHKCTSYL